MTQHFDADLKACPLCNLGLIEGSEDYFDGMVLRCPKQVPWRPSMTFRTHYRHHPLLTVQFSCYRLWATNIRHDPKATPYEYQVDVWRDDSWHKILTMPAFPLPSEDQLIDKIKLLITFS